MSSNPEDIPSALYLGYVIEVTPIKLYKIAQTASLFSKFYCIHNLLISICFMHIGFYSPKL